VQSEQQGFQPEAGFEFRQVSDLIASGLAIQSTDELDLLPT